MLDAVLLVAGAVAQEAREARMACGVLERAGSVLCLSRLPSVSEHVPSILPPRYLSDCRTAGAADGGARPSHPNPPESPAGVPVAKEEAAAGNPLLVGAAQLQVDAALQAAAAAAHAVGGTSAVASRGPHPLPVRHSPTPATCASCACSPGV